jgi:hypothetical protein
MLSDKSRWLGGGARQRTGSANAQIDRCIIEQPYPSSARESTCALIRIGTDSHSFPKNLLPRNEGIRRCYLNFEFTNPRPAPETHVKNIIRTVVSGIVTFETDYPHNVLVNDYVEIRGSSNTAYNKRLQVTSLGGSATDGSSRILQVNYGSDPGAPTGAYITLQQSLPETMRASSVSYSAGTGLVTVTTGQPPPPTAEE